MKNAAPQNAQPAASQPSARYFTVATAGHVDHGKTSLIKALTGIDPDRLKEEKERQMTTDLGFAHLDVDDATIGFVDVPGHGKFLKNMLAGVGGIDLALLVVAADEGPMPQTVQHVRILSLLGVRRAVVAITKIDVVESAEHRAQTRQRIESMLHDHEIEAVQYVEVSSVKHIGLSELKQALLTDLSHDVHRDTRSGAYFPVDRVFSKSGFGTVITGTLVRGSLSVGDQVTIGPAGEGARIRRLESFGKQIERAQAGQRLACNIVPKDPNLHVQRGDVVLGAPLPSTKSLIVMLVDKPRLTRELAKQVSDQPIRLYHGTAERHGSIRWAVGATLGSPAADDPSNVLSLIVLSDPAVVRPGDRFLVRLSDDSIMGGVVLLRDRPRWLKRADAIVVAQKIVDEDYDTAVLDFLRAALPQAVKRDQLAILLPEGSVDSTLSKLLDERAIVQLGTSLLLSETHDRLTQQLVALVKKTTDQQVESGENVVGAPLENVRAALQPRVDKSSFAALIDTQVSSGKLERSSDRLIPAGLAGATTKSAAADPLAEKIRDALAQHFCLDVDDLAQMCGSDAKKIKNALGNMTKSGDVQLINYEFAITSANLHKAHVALADVWNSKRNIAPGDFREALQTSRKYAMALLQHFDDNKITRRLPSGRVLLKGPQRN